MKKLLSLLVVLIAVVGFANEAHAGLNFRISFDAPFRVHRECDEVYRRPVVRYYDEDCRYYRPRRRSVTYYSAPVYYYSEPRYGYRSRGCR